MGRNQAIYRSLLFQVFFVISYIGGALNSREGTAFSNGGGSASQRLRVATTPNKTHFDGVLQNILVPRVVGTASHQRVKEYIKNEMKNLGWVVKTDSFEDTTPIFGKLRFENIIAQLNPEASRVIVLSCHYDSKYIPDVEFLAATDSAVPCAMLINLAHSLQKELTPLKTADVSLEIWFFDGEEAFQHWGPKDSIYGARHLAARMERENTLQRIKLLVLLDLLGAPGSYFYSYFPASEPAYRTLVTSEQHLKSNNHLRAVGSTNGYRGRRKSYFHEMSAPHFVEDDHTPFLKRGVPVLHVIPAEFPSVWHTPNDNWDAIDQHTINDLNMILRLFVLNYFNL